ncbi:hypothetical protein [Arthrospiribacter ruber]|jgi:hypothetical protein|uniref:Uncharacterized protein n=1 Tax=Arthrospiribacter ruber TaxID=2487934 RepID=A0A951MK52_9BACT|nr:hypothetical protein [Arthrospiribacter ruber]MBW3470301.1 hypothetical protein [Arthrospiribacter ruber]
MVRSLFVISMAWMIILNSMVYSVICVNFQLNRSFITEMFCENKDIPMSQCNGQCFLNKQLDQATQDQESSWMDFRSDFNLFTLFSLDLELPRLCLAADFDHVGFLKNRAYQSYLRVLGRPPATASFLL